ncbi:MAG: cupin [Cyanobacteriota bacterium]|nr:cupin [Cyanobacteriota bacterium]
MALSPPAQDPGLSGLSGRVRLYDYRQAANPIRSGLTEPIPDAHWSAPPLAGATSEIIPLDLSAKLGCAAPATSPGLAAAYITLRPGVPLAVPAQATSSLFYVLQGQGTLSWPTAPQGDLPTIAWGKGDVFVLPHGPEPHLLSQDPSLLYWVHDGPLLAYLGVRPATARFAPCQVRAAALDQALAELMADPVASRSNRLSVLLAHDDLPATRTITHTLWAMAGVVPAGAVQPPHRHQSVALDLIIDANPNCYTLVGTELDCEGRIRHPRRVDWEPGAVFITPPGHWHAHVNHGETVARLLPIQDAGLHTYLRSLDIRFAGGSAGEE